MIDTEKRIAFATQLSDSLNLAAQAAMILRAELADGDDLPHYHEHLQVLLSRLADVTEAITDVIATELAERLDTFERNMAFDLR